MTEHKSTKHFTIEVGKGKGAYKVHYDVTNYTQAVRYYNSIIVHSGYKKRLCRWAGTNGRFKRVLAREITNA